MKKCFKMKMVYSVLAIVLSIFIGTLLMVGVYSLPIKNMHKHIEKSIPIYKVEKTYYKWAPSRPSTQLDNWTDATMIAHAIYPNSESIINAAMISPHFRYKDKDPQYSLVQYFSNSQEEKYISNYPRYWHGYLVWLKPFLLFFTISDIRLLNMLLQCILAFWLLLEIYKKEGLKLTIPFGMALISMNPISTALCMQHACMYYIILISCIYSIRCVDINDKYWKIFLWIGISTAFFDFLTCPLAGLGINLLLCICISRGNLKENMKMILMSSIIWGIGYLGMWMGKWLVSFLLTGHNTLLDAINQIKFRSCGEIPWDQTSGFALRCKTIAMNLYALINNISNVIVLIFLLAVFVYFTIQKKIKINTGIAYPALLMFFSPFLWYIIICNHSFIHYWFTYRNLSISILALSVFVFYSVKEEKNNG